MCALNILGDKFMSQVVSQKEAVRSAISQVLSEAGVRFDETTNVKSLMTKELRSQVNQILFEGFRSGAVVLKGEKTDKELRDYVSGLQSNWLNKDTSLTGGVKYIAKNPGSRVGSTDAQIKALRALMANTTVQSEIEELQGYIDTRLAEIEAVRPSKKKEVKVNFDALPESIRTKYSTQA
jgi:hypothetical protein